jgi:hypothetical protein
MACCQKATPLMRWAGKTFTPDPVNPVNSLDTIRLIDTIVIN